MNPAPSHRELGLAAILSVPLALFFAWTQVFPLDGIPSLGTDYGQLVWNMWSVERAVSSFHSPLSTDLMFHPVGTSLAAHVLIPAFFPVTAVMKAVRGRDDLLYPLMAYKIAIGLCYTAITCATYGFLRRIGAGVIAAIAVTISYAFSAFNQLHAPHLNHLSVAAILPLSGWALVSGWERPRLGPIMVVAVLLGGGPYFGELVAFAWASFLLIGVVLISRARTRAEVGSRLTALGGPTLGVAILLALLLVSRPSRM